jgi:hypothetical protein
MCRNGTDRQRRTTHGLRGGGFARREVTITKGSLFGRALKARRPVHGKRAARAQRDAAAFPCLAICEKAADKPESEQWAGEIDGTASVVFDVDSVGGVTIEERAVPEECIANELLAGRVELADRLREAHGRWKDEQ